MIKRICARLARSSCEIMRRCLWLAHKIRPTLRDQTIHMSIKQARVATWLLHLEKALRSHQALHERTRRYGPSREDLLRVLVFREKGLIFFPFIILAIELRGGDHSNHQTGTSSYWRKSHHLGGDGHPLQYHLQGIYLSQPNPIYRLPCCIWHQ